MHNAFLRKQDKLFPTLPAPLTKEQAEVEDERCAEPLNIKLLVNSTVTIYLGLYLKNGGIATALFLSVRIVSDNKNKVISKPKETSSNIFMTFSLHYRNNTTSTVLNFFIISKYSCITVVIKKL